jgi:hypothetical protein
MQYEIHDQPCPWCAFPGPHQPGPGAGPHAASLRCGHCGRCIQWLSTRSPAERQARRQQARLQAMAQKPPSAAQLTYLQALGDTSPPPATMAEASERIDALVRKEVRA